MSALSVVRDGQKAVPLVANPIFLISPLRVKSGAEVTFEVFEEDAAALKSLIGEPHLYHLDGELFWAQLNSLEPCESTHPGLYLLRHKPTLRGMFSIIGESAQTQQ